MSVVPPIARRRRAAATALFSCLVVLCIAINAEGQSQSAFGYASDGATAVSTGQGEVVLSLRPSQGGGSLAALAAAGPGRSIRSRRAALADLTPAAVDRRSVVAFARRHALSVEAASRWTVLLHGPLPVLARLFDTRLERVSSPLEPAAGRAFTAAVSPLEVPHQLDDEVSSAVGLDNRPVWRARTVPAGFTGGTLASAYQVTQGGAGVTVATMQFNPMDTANLTTYANAAGIPLSQGQFTLVSVDGATTAAAAGQGDSEDSLDAEAILATAPSADQRMYVAPNSVAGAVEMDSEIADDAAAGLVQVVSTSWGSCEQETDEISAQDFQLRRILAAGATLFAATGDGGSHDCTTSGAVSVDYPASSPSAVAVGGTSLTQSNGTWTDTGWSNTEGASGGGTSAVETRPSWQSSLPVSGTHRLVPDVASDADPETGFGAYADDNGRSGWGLFGGTSLATPTQAGFLADALSAAGRTNGIGDIHAALYGAPASDFRDVTVGASNGTYSPAAGYDEVTGLGAPLWSGLAATLGLAPVGTTPSPTPSSTPTPTPTTSVSVTPTPSPSATTTASATATVTPRPTVTPTATATMSATAIPAPTSTAPGPGTTVRFDRVTTSRRLTARWSAGPAAGVAYYQVLIATAGQTVYSSLRTTATQRAFTGLPGLTYTLSARAVTRAGAVGRVGTTRQTLPLDDRAAKRSGHWSLRRRHGDYLATESRSAARGSRLRFHVSATSGSLWYLATPTGGKAVLLVDGKRRGVIDTYAPTTRHKRYRWSTRKRAERITIVVLHHKRRASRGYRVVVDALLP